MALAEAVDENLRRFLGSSRFMDEGAVMTDLDGTAVHEFEGRIVIPDPVSHGLKRLNDLGRPIILNSLRFPLNVIRTFGREWYAVTNAPLPLVSLNGGIIGHLELTTDDAITFRELAAFPLAAPEIEEVLVGVEGLVAAGVTELVLFHYPRDWTLGEIIWTPAPDRIESLRTKYLSASKIVSCDLPRLRESLLEREICMLFLLVEVEEDRLMAYQHAKRSSFVTREGVDKLSGAREITARLGLDLAHSVGAGDTPMDSFLKGVGLAVHVGATELEYHGLRETIRIANSLEFGELLYRLADLQGGGARW